MDGNMTEDGTDGVDGNNGRGFSLYAAPLLEELIVCEFRERVEFRQKRWRQMYIAFSRLQTEFLPCGKWLYIWDIQK
jgi:hypothetical protein